MNLLLVTPVLFNPYYTSLCISMNLLLVTYDILNILLVTYDFYNILLLTSLPMTSITYSH